jgi:hypothetical protein
LPTLGSTSLVLLFAAYCWLQDNLLPVSCRGQDWQGGLGLTLVDSLDMLLLLNRRGDVQAALEQLRQVLSFDKDVKVRGRGDG